MSILQLKELSVIFPGRILFEGITWTIFENERYGLIGPNGAGKTTLLKLLLGKFESTSGSISKSKNVQVGYLPQEGVTHKGNTLFQEAWNGLPDLPNLQKEIEELRRDIADDHDNTELAVRLGALEHRWQDLEGYQAEAKVAAVLGGLGFKTQDFARQVEEFSGGWQMRIALAKLLLLDPDLLMLDEPTNHLDLPALDWLENYLQKYSGALVTVSHDRMFLDRIINRIAEIDRGKLYLYPGNYSIYERTRLERQEQLEAKAEKLDSERKHVEAFVERFRYKASKAKQVQSRVKALEKMETVELESQRKKVRFRFPPAPSSGKMAIELNRVSKSFGSKQVFSQVDLILERGEKVALVGINGAGKSTLCRLIVNVDKPTVGHIRLGHNVQVEYFAQEADFHLNSDNTVLAEMESEGSHPQSLLRGMLGAFLFGGDDVFKPVSVLSGGEKSRLALAKLLLHPSNFMILDEPTNHLDIDSKEVLLDALKNYDGTLLVVSHDRYFLDKLVNRVIDIEDGVLRDWPGNFSDYLSRKHLFEDKKDVESRLDVVKSKDQNHLPFAPKSKDQKRAEAEIRSQFSQQLKSAQQNVDKLQQRIDSCEARKSYLEKQLADEAVYKDTVKSKNIMIEYNNIRQELPQLLVEWETASETLEHITQERERQVKLLG